LPILRVNHQRAPEKHLRLGVVRPAMAIMALEPALVESANVLILRLLFCNADTFGFSSSGSMAPTIAVVISSCSLKRSVM
jgi:hypothetical protein